jgi:hypothetical protein
MKLRSITFTEGGEHGVIPDVVVAAMTMAEVVAIAKVFGAMNGYAHEKLALSDSSIYDELTGTVLNRYWDGGLADHEPRWVNLSTLNDEVP